MQTQDVLRRLKRATSGRVQASGSEDGVVYANGRVVLGDYCHNCGEDSLSAVVEARRLVPDESGTDGNEVSLCDDCHEHAYTADDGTAGDTGTTGDTGSADASAAPSYENCSSSALTADASVVRERDDHRCRGCGVREPIVVGDDLHLHPVVPIASDGFRHPHNYVSLCPTCHRKVHA